MIFQWFFWKVLRVGIFISFLLTFIFLIFQIVRLDQILFHLPLRESLPFLILWYVFYFSYMLPTGIFISFSFNLFELKESKKLRIIQSFGINPSLMYAKSLLMLSPVMVALSVVSYMLREEDIGYVRKQLILKYYALVITSVPSKSFQNFGQFTLYVEKREGNTLEGIFFKFQEGVVVSKKAHVKGDEIIFEKGSLLTQREGKTFSTDFNQYRLNLGTVVDQKERAFSRRYVIGMLNALSLPLLMGLAYALVRFFENHHRFYYVVGFISVLYHMVLLLLKQKL